MASYSCVYLVKEREFIKTNEDIIKIGYSNQDNLKRFKSYPKDSVLLFHVYVENGKQCETEILKKFKMEFNHRKDIGNEYFEGDYILMRKIIIEIVERVDSKNKLLQDEISDEINILKDKLENLQHSYDIIKKQNTILNFKLHNIILESFEQALLDYKRYKHIQKEYKIYKYIEYHEHIIKTFIYDKYEITENNKYFVNPMYLYKKYRCLCFDNNKVFPREDYKIITIEKNDYFINEYTQQLYQIIDGNNIGSLLGYLNNDNKIIMFEPEYEILSFSLFTVILRYFPGINTKTVGKYIYIHNIKSKSQNIYKEFIYDKCEITENENDMVNVDDLYSEFKAFVGIDYKTNKCILLNNLKYICPQNKIKIDDKFYLTNIKVKNIK